MRVQFEGPQAKWLWEQEPRTRVGCRNVRFCPGSRGSARGLTWEPTQVGSEPWVFRSRTLETCTRSTRSATTQTQMAIAEIYKYITCITCMSMYKYADMVVMAGAHRGGQSFSVWDQTNKDNTKVRCPLAAQSTALVFLLQQSWSVFSRARVRVCSIVY